MGRTRCLKILFGVIRKTRADGSEFVLKDDLRLTSEGAEAHAATIRKSYLEFDRDHPVARVARLELHEECKS